MLLLLLLLLCSQAMVFALEHADAAADVCEILEEALTLSETPPATKLARLFLVNDILHNSTAPVRNASRYRARLEAVLPEMFVSFNSTYKRAESRMIQEALRRNVLKLLRVWRERFIFNDDYINGLQVGKLASMSSICTAYVALGHVLRPNSKCTLLGPSGKMRIWSFSDIWMFQRGVLLPSTVISTS
eukprot:GHUV01031177.1.p1 GENE.GHUV01031177.1~~GHUV01031177.1.p1  ORF type:complete len:188 (-),score=55.53 GHUV01031177.1:1472-2035(-)